MIYHMNKLNNKSYMVMSIGIEKTMDKIQHIFIVKASRKQSNGHSKHPLPTTQETTLHVDITKWSMLKSD